MEPLIGDDEEKNSLEGVGLLSLMWDVRLPAQVVTQQDEQRGTQTDFLSQRPLLKVLMNAYRLVVIWSSAAIAILLISGFAGFLMQIYFNARLEMQDGQAGSAFTCFCFLPILIVVLAKIVDRVIHLLFDCFDKPALLQSTSWILASPLVRLTYRSTGVCYLYYAFLMAYKRQLRYTGLVRPASTMKEEMTNVDEELTRMFKAFKNQSLEGQDDIYKHLEMQLVDPKTLCVGMTWVISALTAMIFWWMPFEKEKQVKMALLSSMLLSIVATGILKCFGMNCYRTALVHMLAVASTVCFGFIHNWPVTFRICYVVAMLVYLVLQPFFFFCDQMESQQKREVPKDKDQMKSQQELEEQKHKIRVHLPEGLCWAFDWTFFALFVMNPLAHGVAQGGGDGTTFLAGGIYAYLQGILYLALILTIIEIDVYAMIRPSPCLNGAITAAYADLLQNKLDRHKIPGGFVWFAYLERKGALHQIEVVDQGLAPDKIFTTLHHTSLQWLWINLSKCFGVLLCYVFLTMYLPWLLFDDLMALFGSWSIVIVILWLPLIKMVYNALLLFDIACSKVWAVLLENPSKVVRRTLQGLMVHSYKDVRAQRQMREERFRRQRSMFVATLWWLFACYLARPSESVESQSIHLGQTLLLVLTMSHLVWRCSRLFTRVGAAFHLVVLFFFLVAVWFQNAPWLDKNLIPPAAVSPIMTIRDAVAINTTLPRSWPASKAQLPYGACRRKWGSPSAPLTALDLAELSWMAYNHACNVSMLGLLHQSFPGTSTIKSCNEYHSLPRYVHAYFPPKNQHAQGTHVIAVKGTSTPTDVFADTSLFATVQVLQVLSKLVPILSMLPLDLVQKMIFWLDATAPSARRGKLMFQDFEQAVQSVIAEAGVDNVILTGHSLGGGIAQIIANRLNLTAVVFSAPGVIYSAQKLKLSLETTERGTLVVVPDADVVPRVDLQAGEVQRIACRTLNGQELSPASCHSLQRTTCELWRTCGDEADRDFRKGCQNFTNPKFMGLTFEKNGQMWTSPDGSIK